MMTRMICVLICLPTIATAVALANGQDKQAKNEIIGGQLPTLIVELPPTINVNPGRPQTFVAVKTFDVDGDGKYDLELQQKSGRGALSTYYTSSRLVAINGAKLLNGGAVMDVDQQIRPRDLMSATNAVDLCSVGGSLMFPNESFEKFSNGTWWGKIDKGLPLAIGDDNGLRVGYARMSVTKLGEVTFGKSTFKKIDFEPIRFESKSNE